MRFAWMVQPRNLLLFACHFTNECAQLTQVWCNQARAPGYHSDLLASQADTQPAHRSLCVMFIYQSWKGPLERDIKLRCHVREILS